MGGGGDEEKDKFKNPLDGCLLRFLIQTVARSLENKAAPPLVIPNSFEESPWPIGAREVLQIQGLPFKAQDRQKNPEKII